MATASALAPVAPPAPDVVLSVRDLWIQYASRRGPVRAIRGVTFDLRRGESLALIGESGSGKTTMALALVRLLAKAATITNGQILYQRDGKVTNVLTLSSEGLRRFRWAQCAMVFQGAQSAFNPVLRVWDHMADTARAHGVRNRAEVRQRAIRLLRLVGLDPERVLRSFPHEMSGGMRQRVLIAMGLLLDPQVLILDEPTTALDILTQRSIINLLRDLKRELGFSTIFISHDLSLAAELADRVATCYAGRLVEVGPVESLFYHTRHPYSLGLLRAVPRLAGGQHLASIPGSPPDLIDLPRGCTFHPRCPFVQERCTEGGDPPEAVVEPGHLSACYRWQELANERAEAMESER